MGNAYSWYGDGTAPPEGARSRRPSQRRRLGVDRRAFDFYHEVFGFEVVGRSRSEARRTAASSVAPA